jgi:hypothetical protein
MFEREPDQGVVAVQGKLLTNAVAVVLNRAVADEKLFGNHLAREQEYCGE